MATTHAGLSLAELVNLQRIDDEQCVWYTKKSTEKAPQRCCNKVAKPDVDNRMELVKQLPALISFDSDRKEWALTQSSKTHALLEKISEMMLCKGAKHRENSSKLYESWIKELGKAKEKRKAKTNNDASTSGSTRAKVKDEKSDAERSDHSKVVTDYKPTSDQIRKLLDIGTQGKPQCISRTRPCRNLISSKNNTSATSIIGKLTNAPRVTQELEHELLDLAHLLLCKRYHQDQASTIQLDWIQQLRELYSSEKINASPIFTPSRHKTAVAETETPNSVRSTGWSPSSSAGTITPATSPSIGRTGGTNTSAPVSPLAYKHLKAADAISTREDTPNIQGGVERQEEQQYLLHNKVTRRTTLERSRGYLPEPVHTGFVDYDLMTDTQAMVKLMKKLTETLLPSEKHYGYVYGYSRPSCGGLIKIGVCGKDVDARMKGWLQQCKYQPEVVFQMRVPHAMKIERLLHICLYKERKREQSGACNSGRGCEKSHIEWFDITLRRLQDVAAVWQRWIEMEPYDETGSLKQLWRRRFKYVELSGQVDIWRQWLDFSPIKEVTTKIKVETEDHKTYAFSTGSKTPSTFKKRVTSGIVIKETEIKDESEEDDDVLRRRDVGVLARQFNQRIRDIVKPEGSPIQGQRLAAAMA